MEVRQEKSAGVTLHSSGLELPTGPETFAWLRESRFTGHNVTDLRARMAEDGYLFLRDLLDRQKVIEARQMALTWLAEAGKLDPAFPLMEGVIRPGETLRLAPEAARENKALHEALYEGAAIDFFEAFFGAPVRHFDHTWFRTISPGRGTYPHCDIVYMGRGTQKLLTMWTPAGDITLDLGGLMVLEKSHLKADRIRRYLERDVDSYCSNRKDAAAYASGEKKWNGALSNNPVTLREKLGGRWLTAREFRMGDVVVFSMSTIHASLDNQSNRLRLSSDSRYQRADEPADERWVGPNPIGHSTAGKRGRIC